MTPSRGSHRSPDRRRLGGDRARRLGWQRAAGQVAGLALAVPAVGWLVVNQLARNPTAVVAVIAAGGMLLFFAARSGWDRGWKHATFAATAVGLAVAVVQLVQPPDTNPPDPAPAAGPCPVLAEARPVEAIADLEAVGLAFPKVSVELTDDGRGQLYRRFAGTIAGMLPPNSHLYLIGWADPSSRDSTKKRNPGSGLYLLAEEVDPDSRGCWATDRGVLGYRDARGLAIEYSFTLVPDTLQPQLLAYLDTGRYKAAGLTAADFARFGLQRLAFFRVPT